jgi:hypothetical protein
MTYFDCFVVGSWMFALGWFLGAIYVQNHTEETERPRVSKISERWECDAWRVPVAASASADLKRFVIPC